MFFDPQQIIRQADGRYFVETTYHDGTDLYEITQDEYLNDPHYQSLRLRDETVPPVVTVAADGTCEFHESLFHRAHDIRLAAGRLEAGCTYQVVVDFVKVEPVYLGQGI